MKILKWASIAFLIIGLLVIGREALGIADYLLNRRSAAPFVSSATAPLVSSLPSANVVALVIANEHYSNQFERIVDAEEDARNLTRTLKSLTVRVYGDNPFIGLRHDEQRRVIDDFLHSLKPGDVPLVFLKGHGVSIGSEALFLAIDAGGPLALSAYGYDTNALVAALHAASPAAALVVLDMCRTKVGEYKGLQFEGPNLSRANGRRLAVVYASSGPATDRSPLFRIAARALVKPGLPLIDIANVMHQEYARDEPSSDPRIDPGSPPPDNITLTVGSIQSTGEVSTPWVSVRDARLEYLTNGRIVLRFRAEARVPLTCLPNHVYAPWLHAQVMEGNNPIGPDIQISQASVFENGGFLDHCADATFVFRRLSSDGAFQALPLAGRRLEVTLSRSHPSVICYHHQVARFGLTQWFEEHDRYTCDQLLDLNFRPGP